ncbi:hypothetical protein BN844_3365 [Pseudomonas sp. SHC52]|nr:hypothetical protein BN844_3365 [Pseudomonas sp. SHC52]
MLGTRHLTTCMTHPTLPIPRPVCLNEALCLMMQHAPFYIS